MSDANPTPQPAREGAKVPPAQVPESSALLSLAVTVVVVAGLYIGREVLVPITLAVLLSFVLAPLVGLFRQINLGRVPAVILAVVLALSVILAVAGVIGAQVADLASDIPRYATTIQSKVAKARTFTSAHIKELTGALGRQMDAASAPGPAADAPGDTGPAPVEPTLVVVQPPPATPLQIAQQVLSPVLGPLATMAIVFLVAVFILLQQEDLRDRLIRLFGSTDLHRTTVALDDGARRLSKYFLTQLGLNLAFGCIIGAGLLAIGVPNPVLWGIVAALMRFVPYIGAFLSGVLPVALAAAVDPGWSMMIWTLGLFLVAEPVMGQVVEPLVYGHSTGLSPISVVVAAIFWSWLWGPIGLILSTPLTLCLVVLGRHVKRLEFIDVLLGDRPALTPVESFYQRVLAGDADEAQDYAELLLKERSLSSYYDDVALKGLQLAAVDAERGALSEQALGRIMVTVRSLIGELDSHPDRDPAPDMADDGAAAAPEHERDLPRHAATTTGLPDLATLPPVWRGPTPILCVAGHGPLDELASEMLAQLLAKHGLGASLVPHEAASRTNIARLDVQGVAMVCVSYVGISGSLSNLRYLLRRLRRQLPGAPLLVGLWPAEDAVLKEERLRAAIGADYYTGSLNEAVAACLEAAHKAQASGPITEAAAA